MLSGSASNRSASLNSPRGSNRTGGAGAQLLRVSPGYNEIKTHS
jgi:hypothetical protein